MKSFDQVLMDMVREQDARLEASLKKSAELVMEKAKELAPVDTGELVNSASVKEKSNKEFEVKFSAPYSVYVHYDAEARHNIGEAFFLEKAVIDQSQIIFKTIKDDLTK